MLDTAIFIVEVVVFVAASLHLVYRLFLSPPAPSPSPQISDAPAMDRDVREAARTAGGGRHTKTGVALADAAPVDVSAMGFSAEEVVRTRLEAVLELAGVADCNALPSATSNVSLALEDVLLTELPALPALAHLRQLSLRVDPPEMPLPGLSLLTHVSRLKLSGPALQAETLRAVGALPELQSLDLSESRAVVDANNDVRGFLQAQDVFDFQRERRLTTLVLPPTAYVRVGHVVRTFPKASVVVVAIAQPLRVGDIVCLQRIKSTFEPVALGEDADAHRWRSEQTTIDSIRTDDHRQLQEAIPLPDKGPEDIDNQIAFRVSDMGRAGDDVLWCGHASIATLRLRRPAKTD